jgi:hypothetical protein
MLPTETIHTAQYTWSVSPEYIELHITPLVVRITNSSDTNPKIKHATPALGESVVFYGGDDMKLFLERKGAHFNVKLFHGRRNIVNYSDQSLSGLYHTLYERYRPQEKRELPHGAEDSVTLDTIATGDEMITFHDEFRHGRYYKLSTYERIPVPKKNPHTRALIHDTTRYKAKVRAHGGTRKNRH